MDLAQMRAGDVQLFRGSGVFGWLTRTKTWSDVGHVEVYLGDGRVVTARSEGVRIYPARLDHCYVYRPETPIVLAKALAWFTTTDPEDGVAPNQQGYDWIGLLLSFVARKQGRHNKRMFCSEVCTRFLRHGGVEPFAPECDADSIAPAQFKQSPHLARIWSRQP